MNGYNVTAETTFWAVISLLAVISTLITRRECRLDLAAYVSRGFTSGNGYLTARHAYQQETLRVFKTIVLLSGNVAAFLYVPAPGTPPPLAFSYRNAVIGVVGVLMAIYSVRDLRHRRRVVANLLAEQRQRDAHSRREVLPDSDRDTTPETAPDPSP